jgi:hypothetical protein
MLRSRAALSLVFLCACQSTIDPQTPRKYRCNRELNGPLSAECPGNWRCGIEDSCHDPNEQFPFACETQADCAPTWHCGVAGVCYDRTTATDVPCRMSVPDDCAPGWRCGLNNHCHDRDAGSDYACLSDTDCEKGWRCDLVGGLCIDSSAEALRAGGALAAARVSPPLFGVPDLFSVSDPFYDPAAPDCLSAQIATLTDGGLSTIVEWLCQDALVPLYAARFDATLPATGARGLLALETKSYVLDSTSLARFDSATQGVQSLGPVAADALRLTPIYRDDYSTSVLFPPLVFVTGPTQYGLVDVDSDTFTSPLTVAAVDGGRTGILDVAELASGSDTFPERLLAATQDGLFFIPRDDGWLSAVTAGGDAGLVPVQTPVLGNAACGSPPAQRPLRLSINGNIVLALQEPPPGSTSGAVTWQVINSQGAYDTCDAGIFPYSAGPCPACPEGERVLDVSPGTSDNAFADSQCAQPDGGSHFVEVGMTNGSCTSTDLGVNTDSRFSPGPLRSVGVDAPFGSGDVIDEQGRPFLYQQGLLSTLPTVGPVRVAGGGDSPLFTTTWFVDDNDISHGSGWQLTDAGFVGRQFDPDLTALQFCSGVSGAPSLIVRTQMALTGPDDNGNYQPADPNAPPLIVVTSLDEVLATSMPNDPTLSHPVAQLASTQGLPASVCWPDTEPSVRATVAKTAMGPDALLVAVQDTIWAGVMVVDAGTLIDGGQKPPELLQPQVTPVPRGRITSLATTDPDIRNGEFVSGYAVAQLRLFHIFGLDANQWGQQEVQLPSGVPIGVWADGASARVAFASGRVLSLPSRSELIGANSIANGILAVAGFCSQGYAMTPDGVYRLEPDPTTPQSAKWVRVPLGIDTPSTSNGAFVDGALYSTPSALYVFNRFGTAVAVGDANCP